MFVTRNELPKVMVVEGTMGVGSAIQREGLCHVDLERAGPDQAVQSPDDLRVDCAVVAAESYIFCFLAVQRYGAAKPAEWSSP